MMTPHRRVMAAATVAAGLLAVSAASAAALTSVPHDGKLRGAGAAGWFRAAIENDLFNQPPDTDSSCGIRQLLLMQQVLSGGPFVGDIAGAWQAAAAATAANYHGDIPARPGLAALFLKPAPVAYTPADVAAVDTGPQTLPSSMVQVVADTSDDELVRVYVDRARMAAIFGATLFDREQELLEQIFPNVRVVEIQADDRDARGWRRYFDNNGSYYAAAVNNAQHWVGFTSRAFYDSSAAGPSDSPGLGSYSFAGLVLEFAPRGQGTSVAAPDESAAVNLDVLQRDGVELEDCTHRVTLVSGDTFAGTDRDDVVCATVSGDGDEPVTIDLGDGDDTLLLTDTPEVRADDLPAEPEARPRTRQDIPVVFVVGGRGNDTIVSTALADITFSLGSGNDAVVNSTGTPTIFGGLGYDLALTNVEPDGSGAEQQGFLAPNLPESG